MYNQSYPCICKKNFNSLQQYQLHKNKEHPDPYYTTCILPVYEENEKVQFPLCNWRQPNLNMSYFSQKEKIDEKNPQSFLVTNLNQIPTVGQFVQNHYQDSPYPHQNFQYGMEQLSEQISHDKRYSTSLDEKQMNLKYFQNLYKQKMSHFYRQFDIQPYKKSSRIKSKIETYQEKLLQKKYSLKDHQYSLSTTISDFYSVEEQLYLRMKSVIHGLTDFIQIFQKNNQQAQAISPIEKQMVSQMLKQKLLDFFNINSLNQQRLRKFQQNQMSSNDFMNSDLLTALDAFRILISRNLKPSNLWIAESIMIILLDVLINQISDLSEDPICNLKINDIYRFLSEICSEQKKQKNILPIQFSPQDISQFLIYFCQWCTIKQYEFNKFNIDFVDSILDGIHQINSEYHENVTKYKKCAQNKKDEYYQRIKNKPEQKTKSTVGILNSNQLKASNQNNLKNNIKLNKFRDEKPTEHDNQNILPKNDIYYYPLIQKTFDGRFNNSQKQEINAKSLNFNRHQRSYKEQFKHGLNKQSLQSAYKKAGMTTLQIGLQQNLQNQEKSQKSGDQIDEDEFQQEGSNFQMQKFPVFQSMYVNYFSSQCVQARKKQKQIWKLRIQKLKQIVQNPMLYKKQLKNQVFQQLKQINQMLKIFPEGLQFYPQQFMKNKGNIYLQNRNQWQKYNPKQKQHELSPQIQSNRVHSPSQKPYPKQKAIMKDPFIIKKNYRKRRPQQRNRQQRQINYYRIQNESSPGYYNSKSHQKIQLQDNVNNNFKSRSSSHFN